MNNYVAVVKRTSPDDEIKHWKYIKRIKGKNGKWIYIYDKSELARYDRGDTIVEDYTTKDGLSGTSITQYERSNKLFDRKTTSKGRSSFDIGNSTVTLETRYITKSQGKLSRAQAKGEKWVYDNLLKSRNKTKIKRDISKSVDKGKKKIEKFLKTSK